jgi:hypothetical protein
MNAYVTCASSGKAVVNLDGATVHSVFKLTQSKSASSVLSRELLRSFRLLFQNVKCVVLDDINTILTCYIV